MNHRFPLLIDQEEREALRKLAADDRTSITHQIRRAVRMYILVRRLIEAGQTSVPITKLVN